MLSLEVKTQSTKKKLRTGFTLIEVILAIGIFAIGTLAAINLFPKGLRLGREAKETSVATSLAQEQVEEVLAQNYDDIATGTIEPKARIDSNPNSQFYIYQRQTAVNFADSNLSTTTTDTGLKKITVTVYYPEGAQEKTIQIIRLLNKK